MIEFDGQSDVNLTDRHASRVGKVNPETFFGPVQGVK